MRSKIVIVGRNVLAAINVFALPIVKIDTFAGTVGWIVGNHDPILGEWIKLHPKIVPFKIDFVLSRN